MQTDAVSISNARRITGNVLVVLSAFVLNASAAAKFVHVPKVVAELSGMGFGGNKLLVVAALEVLSALLLVIPFTRSGGVLMASAYLGGAIASHMQHDQPIFGPSLVLGLLWLATWLRHPQVLWSFRSENGMRQPARALAR